MQESIASITEDMRKAIEDRDARRNTILFDFGKAMEIPPPGRECLPLVELPVGRGCSQPIINEYFK